MAGIIVELLFIVWFTTSSLQSISAQQANGGNVLFDCKDNSAEGPGYLCDGAENSCDSYALFHSQPPYQSLFSIGKLFNVGIDELASTNNLSTRDSISNRDQEVLIPLKCRCKGNHYQASLWYNISNGGSYFSFTKALQGLTSCEAHQNQNPARSLRVEENILIPLRCACPTAEQIWQGVKHFMTYPVKDGDTLNIVADAFNTTGYDIIIANTLQGIHTTFLSCGSLLVPLKNKPVIHHTLQVPAAAPPPPPGNEVYDNSTLLVPLKNKPVIHHTLQVPAAATPTPPGNEVYDNSSNVIKARRKKKRLKIGLYIGIIAGTIAVAGAIGTCFLVTRMRNKSFKKPATTLQYKRSVMPKSEDGSVSGKRIFKDRVTGTTDLLALTYTLDQLRKATENFSPECRIEGSVYHGILGCFPLAIKQIKGGASDKLRKLCQVQHNNLIRLLGTCNEGRDHSYLIFEYAENGSLSDWLHGGLVMKSQFITSCSRFLTWDQRLHICLDVAMGLQYIHEFRQPSYLHKDITSSNILLTAEFKAKIANFNMGTKLTASGTPGYMAPEYLSHGLLTTKTDIYAFGIVLLEILSGQPPIMMKGTTKVILAETIGSLFEASNLIEELKGWMDPSMYQVYAIDQALALAKLAKSCVERDPGLRPTMEEIKQILVGLVDSLSTLSISPV